MCGENGFGAVGNIIQKTVKTDDRTWRDAFGLSALSQTGRELKDGLESTGVKKRKPPDADPAAERAAAEAEAATKANTRIAFQRRAMRENSLLTGGGQAAAGAGRSTLGV